MVKSMRTRFDEQLRQLNVELIRMGSLCEEAISIAAKVLEGEKNISNERVFAIEGEIDQLEHDIESLCMRMLLQQQPVASDLRVISAALKMITDMERIGDQAADIAEVVTMLEAESAIEPPEHISAMAEEARRMVHRAIDAYVQRDVKLAEKVIAQDDVVDDLFLDVKRELVEQIRKKPDCGMAALDMLMIAKYFERIGDHATNVAEWVQYAVMGLYKGESLA